MSNQEKELSDAVKKQMLLLAKHIYADPGPKESRPGFCLGSVIVDSDNDFENADMSFNMAGHPDVIFDVWMSNQGNDPNSLQQRLQGLEAMADGHRLKVLRSRDLTLGGNPAREELSKVVETRVEYHFVAESRPQHPSLENEGINVTLSTGGQLHDGRHVDSSLNQDEALALWDAIIKSFRPRPNAVHASGDKPAKP